MKTDSTFSFEISVVLDEEAKVGERVDVSVSSSETKSRTRESNVEEGEEGEKSEEAVGEEKVDGAVAEAETAR